MSLSNEKLRKKILECKECFGNSSEIDQSFNEELPIEYNMNHRCLGQKYCLFGHGSLKADIMLVGESPSLKPAGNKIVFGHKSLPIFLEILKIWNKKLDEIYITNMVKCYRPYENVGNEEKCLGFLKDELFSINPRVVVLFGEKVVMKFSSKILGAPLSLWGGTLKDKGVFGRIYVALPHPMVCIYKPQLKTKYFETVKKVNSIINEANLCSWFK